eukprot:scaffold539_cov359-Prasinococcus_capsulatus_cf.AAC.27
MDRPDVSCFPPDVDRAVHCLTVAVQATDADSPLAPTSGAVFIGRRGDKKNKTCSRGASCHPMIRPP